MKQKKPLTEAEALSKLEHYCAYQERSQQQAREKLYDYGLYQDEVENVLSQLISEDFINEERFAKSYAGGKFRIKKWGRIKIINGLKQHRISSYCLKKALTEIDEEDYIETLNHVIEKKRATLNDADAFVLNQKIARFAIGRGFEPNLIWSILKEK